MPTTEAKTAVVHRRIDRDKRGQSPFAAAEGVEVDG